RSQIAAGTRRRRRTTATRRTAMHPDSIRLETDRLILRPPIIDDLDSWSEMMADADTTRFIGGVASRPVCWRQLMTMIGAWHAQGFAMFSVIEKATGRW